MKRSLLLTVVAAIASQLPLAALAGDAGIKGDYLESRTADVYTAACFANAEVNLAGKRAMMAWRVRSGGWMGERLEGLSVVAVVRARATLGDPFADPLPAQAVLLVDEGADSAQRLALIEFARRQGGPLLADIVSVHSVPIQLDVSRDTGFASLKAGKLAELTTRPFNDHDKICGNENLYYQPLTEVSQARAAFALTHRYNGDGLGGTWSKPDKRSAFLASFAF